MPREATQEAGREALQLTRRWLESSTYIELPWNAYKHDAMCRVTCLDGSTRGFDLSGLFLDDQRRIYVENKGAAAPNKQYIEFRKFLAIAYSSTAHGVATGLDQEATFIWVTTHPFGYSDEWLGFESAETIRKALGEFPELLDGKAIDEDLLRTVASRIWLLVLNTKQKRLLLTVDEIQKIYGLLGRKEDTL